MIEPRANESMTWVLRRHWAVYVPLIIGCFGLVLATLFLFEWFTRWGIPGALAFTAVFVASILVTSSLFVRWWFTRLMLTNKRVVLEVQRGIFHRDVIEIPLEQVITVGYSMQGFSAVLVGFGELVIHSGLSTPLIKIEKLPNPKKLREDIIQLLPDRARTTPDTHVTLAEGVRLLKRLNHQFGADRMREMLELAADDTQSNEMSE